MRRRKQHFHQLFPYEVTHIGDTTVPRHAHGSICNSHIWWGKYAVRTRKVQGLSLPFFSKTFCYQLCGKCTSGQSLPSVCHITLFSQQTTLAWMYIWLQISFSRDFHCWHSSSYYILFILTHVSITCDLHFPHFVTFPLKEFVAED